MSAEPTRVTQQVLAGTHPDVTVLTTNKVTIGIDQVREIITASEQMPATAPWRIIIIEDVDRMLERTTNVLLKEIEEPAEHCIWLLCAPSAQDVLPTILARTHREPRRALHPGGGRIPDLHHQCRAKSGAACGPTRRRPYRHRQVVRHRRTGYVRPR